MNDINMTITPEEEIKILDALYDRLTQSEFELFEEFIYALEDEFEEFNPSIGYLKQIDFQDESVSMLDEILKVYKDIFLIENKKQYYF